MSQVTAWDGLCAAVSSTVEMVANDTVTILKEINPITMGATLAVAGAAVVAPTVVGAVGALHIIAQAQRSLSHATTTEHHPA